MLVALAPRKEVTKKRFYGGEYEIACPVHYRGVAWFGLETARAALERGDAVVAAAGYPKVLERGNLLKGGAVNGNYV